MNGSSLAANLRPSQPTQGSMRFDRRMPTTHSKSSSPKILSLLSQICGSILGECWRNEADPHEKQAQNGQWHRLADSTLPSEDGLKPTVVGLVARFRHPYGDSPHRTA